MQTNQINHKNIFIIIVVTFCAFCIFILVSLILATKQATKLTVNLQYTPLSATVTINGQPYSPGTIELPLGTYEVVAEKFGFETQTMIINKDTNAFFILTPNEEFTKDWYLFHENDSMLSMGITEESGDAQAALNEKLYPFIKKLPVKEKNFSIYTSYNCIKDDVCFVIDSVPKYFETAKEYFRNNLSSDLGAYEIYFKDNNNIFNGEG